MAKLSAHEPLLSNGEVGHGRSKSSSFLPTLVNLVLKCLIWAIFIIWVAVIFFNPTKALHNLLDKWIKLTEGSIFGFTGSIFLGFSGPILIIAFLAFIYVIAFPRDNFEIDWDTPVFYIRYLEYYLLYNTRPRQDIRVLIIFSGEKHLHDGSCWCAVGLDWFILLGLSFSASCKGVNSSSFDRYSIWHATRYHVWLGHLTMVIFTSHGLFFVISWSLQGNLHHKILEWKDTSVANLPGVISLTAGLFMWVTSLHPMRKNYFELFFYAHQLYVIFIVFLALHVGDFVFSIAAGAIFIFILDRFLRFCQSRTKVDVISAACRPCGTVELILSKPIYSIML